MQKKLLIKLGVLALLALALLVPLGLIEGQIAARSQRQQAVEQDLAETAASAQMLTGPVLAIRYRERTTLRERNAQGHETVRQDVVERIRVLPPQRLDIDGSAEVELRQRGIYRGHLYHLDAQLGGRLALPAGWGIDDDQRNADGRELIEARAFLVLGVSDLRGIANDPAVRINDRSAHFSPGTLKALAGAGLHIDLGELDPARPAQFDFRIPLKLTGSTRLSIAPAGDATTVQLRSSWPHPSFQGRFLPQSRSLAADGFSAQWQVSHLARSFERVLAAGATARAERPEALSISFIDPVNVYLKSERAVKYGVLFVALTFAAFFLVEVLRRQAIHPLQYLLVGLALAAFFLLLVALSEHVAFGTAYALAAGACIALIASYLCGVLGTRRGLALSGGIGALYAVLYGVLLSEDNAMLMGTLLLFAALATVMLATRHVDWYRIGQEQADD